MLTSSGRSERKGGKVQEKDRRSFEEEKNPKEKRRVVRGGARFSKIDRPRDGRENRTPLKQRGKGKEKKHGPTGCIGQEEKSVSTQTERRVAKQTKKSLQEEGTKRSGERASRTETQNAKVKDYGTTKGKVN